jgi:hypothetical protein
MELENIKLKKVTSSELKDEYERKMSDISSDTNNLNFISSEIQKIIASQNEQIQTIHNNIDSTSTHFEQANNELIIALNHQTSYNLVKSSLLTLSTICLTIPTVILFGPKIAGVGVILMTGIGIASFF